MILLLLLLREEIVFSFEASNFLCNIRSLTAADAEEVSVPTTIRIAFTDHNEIGRNY